MKENIIKSICWDITSNCNDNCDFCYRNYDNKELDFNNNITILKKLIDMGVDKISFVGGEPLLYKDLFILLEWGKKYAKHKTMFSITTNAVLLTHISDGKVIINVELMQKLCDLFEWITFSLDAPNGDIQSLMGRNFMHFERIIVILEYLNNMGYQNKIKINTVASLLNIDYLFDLYKLLCRYNIKRWKIFHFLPSRGNALKNRDRFYISEEVFMDKVQEINNYNITKQIEISVNGYDKFDNSYITISSEGKLVVYNNGKYVNELDLLNEDVMNILKYIDIERHEKNRSDFLYI